tara:strand:+ start:2887 stop:3840 length:954 start_codon:yes stop_codon:yes gene_type:complete
MRKKNILEVTINAYLNIENEFKYAKELFDLGEAEEEFSVRTEAFETLQAIQLKVSKLQIESLLSGEADQNDCFLEVHAGAGGTESQDWAEMLIRMYTRWSDSRSFKTEWIEESAGEEAGVKSATIRINGHYAYGWMKAETGVHRLVRISPFDSSSRRHTSFASVGVYPVVDDEINIDVDEKELRVDTYRASGAGGQHVNRTDSAVRITHIPSGIVVQCQSGRSQHKNRASAMKMLKSRLYEQEIEKQEAQRQADYNSKTEIGWSHQIRSYVLHPYQLVKDLRTGFEKGNAQSVLDGNLDEFMETTLAYKVNFSKNDV